MIKKELIVDILIKQGTDLLKEPRKKIEFTKNNKADEYLNNLEEYSHHFVLACTMDRQIKAEKAWIIPFNIGQEFGGQSFDKFASISREEIKYYFETKKPHRYNDTMGTNFYKSIQRIKDDYNGEASKIWVSNPKSATIIRRFFRFDGVGIKIARMAAYILSRQFKIPMQDKICIVISPDIQVKRVFKRLGFIDDVDSNDDLIYCARELNPEYPGIFDSAAWELGKDICRPTNPKCDECFLNELCPKNI